MENLNNTRMPFSACMDKANAIQADCQDYLVRNVASNLFMDDDAKLHFDGEVMPCSSWALSQLGIKTGIPSQYLEKCIDAGFPDLAADNVNRWLTRRDNTDMFIRSYRGQVRGILSNRYTCFDAPDILENLYDVVDERFWNIKGSFQNEERMHIRLIGSDSLDVGDDLLFPNLTADPLFPAIFVDSSDVGRCALNISFGIWRQVCTNGLVVPAVEMEFHHRHIGISAYQMVSSVQEILSNLPLFMTHASELIEHAAQNNLKTLTEDELRAVIKNSTKGVINGNEADRLITFARETYPMTQWGLVNAMTEYAQNKTLDTREDIEAAAGRLLSMKIAA